MILTIEETKQFFRENKELIKKLDSVVFRWETGKKRFTNQTNGKTLREIGNHILELSERGSHFSFGQVWKKENNKPRGEYDYVPETKEQFIEQLKSGELRSFAMSPHTPMTFAEKMGAGHYGSLD
jgi:hypothetical protein